MKWGRRRWTAAATALCAAALMPGGARALAARPRLRVIVDNDFSGDPDGLFQLAHHLLAPSVEIAFVIGSHIHKGDFLDGSAVQADNAAARAAELCATLRLARRPPIVAGQNEALVEGRVPRMTAAARRIIAEAMRDDTSLPLFYAAGAGLTDLAAAVRLEPRIGKRIVLVWIGGAEHGDLLPGVPVRTDPEYNQTIDELAVRTIFNESAITVWQVPRNVYRQMLVSHAELRAGLARAGRLGTYLMLQLDRVVARMGGNLGETYILGDSPLVTLTALQSPFEPDSSSSPYVVRPTPRIGAGGRYEADPGGRPMRVYTAIDTRLTFGDMFASFAAGSR